MASLVTSAIGPPGPDVGGGGGAAAVSKDHVTGDIVLPDGSRAPLSVTLKGVEYASWAVGVSVAVRVLASYAVVDATTAEVMALRSTIEIEPATTPSLNVADGRTVAGTPVVPGAGRRVVTVGAVPSSEVSE